MIITAGIYKGRKITAPNEKITRPTLSKVRMGVFNALFSILGDFSDKSFLDVFGGSGIMGLEALSRGFGKVKVFEINKKSAQIIKNNYALLGLKPDLVIGDSVKLMENMEHDYDVIYIDPPYESGIYEAILSKVKSGIVVVEHSENIDITGFMLIKEKNYGGKKITILNKII